MKKLTKTLLLTAALLAGLSMPAMAANVQATLPSFPVTLNGTVIDNSYRQYPLLVYNNITYFPMTYYDCRFLGVETEWTQAGGLKIEKSNLTWAYHQQNVQQKNSGKATAQLATGKIAVNGKAITNSKEQYPLLVYRDVTYFPLTWRFAVDEFGWKYSYDNKNGLVIDAGNVKTSSVTLKDARQNRGIYDNSDFIIDKNYLYYQGENGSVYRRPLAALDDDKQRKQIMEIPYEDVYVEGYPRAGFYEERGHVYMQYHLGGATMGSDLLYRIDGDTVSENLIQKQSDIVSDFGDLQVQIPRCVIGGINPAKIIVKTAQGSREVGEAGKIYNLVANGYQKEKNELYVLAADWEQETGTQGDSYLYRLNLYTDAFQKVYHEPVEDCVYDGADYYIWQDLQHQIWDGATVYGADTDSYMLSLLDLPTGEKKPVAKVNGYTAIAKHGVYYQATATKELIFWNKQTGKTETINAGFKVKQFCSQNGYIIAHFEEMPENPYRLMVFAPSGQTMKQVYATADCSDKAVINADGLLVYRLEGTNQLVQVQL